MTAHAMSSPHTLPKPSREYASFPSVRRNELAKIPGRKGLPWLGILPEAVMDPFSFTRRMYNSFGPIHCFYACGNWNVQLVGPEANEFVLFDRPGNFSAYGGWKPVFGRHFDGGLLLRDGLDHQWHRKLVATAFKQPQLEAYLQIFAANGARFRDNWSGRVQEVYDLAQQLTFANGFSAFLGRDSRSATPNDLLAFRYMMRSATAVLPWALPGTAHGRASWAKSHIEKLLRPTLRQKPADERPDLASALTRMLHEGSLTYEEVLAHLTFTIAASFDTLSSATVSTIFFLALHPQWQDRCATNCVPRSIQETALRSPTCSNAKKANGA